MNRTAAYHRVGNLLRSGQDVPVTFGTEKASWAAALECFGLQVVPACPRALATVPTARTYPAIEAFIAAGMKDAA